MSKKRWLVAWIGGTDHEAAEGKLGKDIGPIATALQDQAARYDRVYLLTNYPHERSVAFCDWLAAQTGFDPSKVDLFDIELKSPVDYDAIYAEVSKNLKEARLPRDDVELTFHLSPGTPAMAVIWIILARTRFPAHLIQTTREKGVLDVRFFTDVTDAFLPEFLQRSGERIERLAGGPAEVRPSSARSFIGPVKSPNRLSAPDGSPRSTCRYLFLVRPERAKSCSPQPSMPQASVQTRHSSPSTAAPSRQNLPTRSSSGTSRAPSQAPPPRAMGTS